MTFHRMVLNDQYEEGELEDRVPCPSGAVFVAGKSRVDNLRRANPFFDSRISQDRQDLLGLNPIP